MNYARRQQYRRLSRAGTAAVRSGAAALLGLVIASVGAISLAGLFLLTAIGLGLYSRHWFGLARRSRVGAQAETEVRRFSRGLKRRDGGSGTGSGGAVLGMSTPWR